MQHEYGLDYVIENNEYPSSIWDRDHVDKITRYKVIKLRIKKSND